MYYTGCYLGYIKDGQKKPCYVYSYTTDDCFDDDAERYFVIEALDKGSLVQEKIGEEDLITYPPYVGWLENSWLHYEAYSSYKKGWLGEQFYANDKTLTRSLILSGLSYDKPNPTKEVDGYLVYKGKVVTNKRLLKWLRMKRI